MGCCHDARRRAEGETRVRTLSGKRESTPWEKVPLGGACSNKFAVGHASFRHIDRSAVHRQLIDDDRSHHELASPAKRRRPLRPNIIANDDLGQHHPPSAQPTHHHTMRIRVDHA